MAANINIRMPQPSPWQAAVMLEVFNAAGSGNTYTIKSKRQIGKSTLIEWILLQYATMLPGCTSMFVAPTLIQSRKLFKDLVRADVTGQLFTVKNGSLLELTTLQGSQILLKSAEQRENLRGFTITGILCIDEAAYIQDDVFDILRPTTDVHNAPTLVCSTPRFKSGNFYRYYNFGKGNQRGFISFDWSEYDTSALLSPEKLEMYRTQIPASQFTTEYLGEFLDSDAILFKDFRACVKDGQPMPYGSVFMGIDWGSGVGGDSTALSAINERGEQVLCEDRNELNTTQTIEWIAETYARLSQGHKVTILAEVNSIGKPFVDLLRAKGIQVREWVTSNKSKADLVTALQVAFEQKEIVLFPSASQEQQLSMYQCDYNPRSGIVTYNAPQGFHDDKCIALMLSWRCYLDNTRRTKYNISFL